VSASKLIRDLIQLLVNNVMRALFPSLHLTFFDVAIDQVRQTNTHKHTHMKTQGREGGREGGRGD
jgi:hypothetical protein